MRIPDQSLNSFPATGITLTSMKLVTVLLLIGLTTLFSGCIFWDDCRPPSHIEKSWTRRVTATETHTVYSDAGHPTYTQVTPDGYEGYYELYHAAPYERDKSVASTAPRAIRLTFLVLYTGEALVQWRSEGFFENDSLEAPPSRGYLYHEINLKPGSLAVGTYPFTLEDTTRAARGTIKLQITRGLTLNAPSLAVTSFTGSITITEAFTEKSGKFSYTAEAVYLTGQRSTFQGNVSFDGVRFDESCMSPGVP
jgi:hypothetical protein